MGRETSHYVFRDIDEGLSIGLTEPENTVTDIIFSSPRFFMDLDVESVRLSEVVDILDPSELKGHGKVSYWEKEIGDEIEYGLDVYGQETGIQSTKQDFLDAYTRPEQLYRAMDENGLDPRNFELDLLERFACPMEPSENSSRQTGFMEGVFESGDMQYLETGERAVIIENVPDFEDGEEVRVYGELEADGFEGRQEGVFYLDAWQIDPIQRTEL